MRFLLVLTLLFWNTERISAAETPELQTGDYPVTVSIRCSVNKGDDDFPILPRLASQILPSLSIYGYSKQKNTDYSIYGQTLIVTDNIKYPYYIVLEKHESDGVLYIDVSTLGDASNPNGYTGHSDEFTYQVVKLIKPLVNKAR